MAAKSSTKPSGKSATPKAAAATSKATAPSSTASESKKRVRVVEEDEAAAVAESPKSAKKANKKTGSTIEKRDLRDKAKDLSSIERISSKDAPKPTKGALKKSAAPAAEEEIALDQEDEEDDAEEEIDFLAGFEESGDEGEDSSDEEMDEGNAEPFKVEALPKVNGKDEASVQKKLEAKAERRKNAKSGTIYLGRIPHGFHEDEMRSYFSQFGEITRLRLSRNKKTGASKHYAFIEFAYASVAQIVHETMDNYLLSGHILVCKVVPDDQIHPKMWIGANRKFRPVPKGRVDAVRRNAPKTEEQQSAIAKRLLKKEQAKRKQLASLGIEYDFAGYEQKQVAAPKPAKETPVKTAPAAKKGKASSAKKASAKADEPAKKKARKST